MEFTVKAFVERRPCLYSEALTTLAPPGRNHGATALGAHANEEAVRALASPVIRLKSAFHLLTS